ncbi:hypothetical protein [Nocardioides pantholopis]|nr:hypothetical protein [Nocardioides pantholopis]
MLTLVLILAALSSAAVVVQLVVPMLQYRRQRRISLRSTVATWITRR